MLLDCLDYIAVDAAELVAKYHQKYDHNQNNKHKY